MPASSAIGLAVLAFVLGVLFGRMMGRSGPQVHSFGPDDSQGSVETAMRRGMAATPPATPSSAPSGPTGIDFAAAGAGAPASSGNGVFRIILTEPGRNKINTIKAIREVTRLDLKDSKDLCERTPTVLARASSQAEANRIAQQFDGVALVRVEQV